MSIAAYIRYLLLMRRTRPRRYRSLFRTIQQNTCRTIVEIGVYNGNHALQMIQTASINHSAENISYFGFDLFEDLNEDMLEKELSKRPLSCDVIQRKLEKTGASIRLFKGNTNSSLPRHIDDIGKVDFIFIDGGHSEETISSDWSYARKLMKEDTIVIFDDYYMNNEPETKGFGCMAVVNGLDRELYDVEILDPMDVFSKDYGSLKIKMAKVQKNRQRRMVA